MNAVKKAIFGVMAGAVIVATVAGSSVFGTHVPVRQPAEPAGDPFIIEQSETSGVSLSAEVQPTAANATAIGTQRVTATVEPASAIYDLEWSLSVGSSLIPEDSISDYLAITPVSNNSIDLVCYQRFDGYATLQVEDGYTGKTASADVCAWTFDDTNTAGQFATNTDFSANTTGETSWTFHNNTANPNPQFLLNPIVNGWYLYGYTGLSADRVTATDIDEGLLLMFYGTLVSGDVISLLTDVPYYTQGNGAQKIPSFYEGDEVYIVAETSREPSGIFYRGSDDGNQYTDSTVLHEWYQNGIYVCHLQLNSTATPDEALIGIRYGHSIGSYFSVTVKSVEIYRRSGNYS